jgi:hypothetical protein
VTHKTLTIKLDQEYAGVHRMKHLLIRYNIPMMFILAQLPFNLTMGINKHNESLTKLSCLPSTTHSIPIVRPQWMSPYVYRQTWSVKENLPEHSRKLNSSFQRTDTVGKASKIKQPFCMHSSVLYKRAQHS